MGLDPSSHVCVPRGLESLTSNAVALQRKSVRKIAMRWEQVDRVARGYSPRSLFFGGATCVLGGEPTSVRMCGVRCSSQTVGFDGNRSPVMRLRCVVHQRGK